ncbi:hypothetical protein GALMADRAFT_263374 [Galerina marginata CBS 339.88]|uniref:Uncharacterized protein n=1 Tax=Galerina marginata (strain CBS 339.88) TaxID=685588 RepID=A0A067TKR7_GALM3|nr:hypothetical protein GALMADRAFT_263374 [Galerina marginata CBS 339.88]
MSRKPFEEGLSCYKAGNYPEALQHFSKAIERGGPNCYNVLDSRAAVYLKIGDLKSALKDAKHTIDLAPDRWQGHARAARVFFRMKKFDRSRIMVKMAMDRLKDEETERRASLLSLKAEVDNAEAQVEAEGRQVKRDLERRRRLFADHMGSLPIEIFGEIGKLLARDNHSASIILSQVSKPWRAVVHNLPYLWDVLVLTRRRPRQKAKLWIQRSKGRIRELIIRSSVLDIPHWSGDSLDLLQWSYLRAFRVQNWDVVSFLESIGQLHSLSNLECHEIERPMGKLLPFGGTSSSLSAEADDGSQPLRQLIITSAVLPAGDQPIRVSNLTSLILQDVATDGGYLADLLEANPLLQHLTLKNIGYGNNTGDSKDAKTSLPCLSVLEIKGLHPPFIYALSLPELQTLRVEYPTTSHNLNNLLRHLVATNTSHLTEITLRSCSCDSTSIIDLLRISPDLQHLEISNNSNQATLVVEALADFYTSQTTTNLSPPATNPEILCPNLTHVNFSKCPSVQTGPLVRMIKFRLPQLPSTEAQQQGEHAVHRPEAEKITSLVIDECHQVDPAWLNWFREKVGSVSCVYMKKKAKFRT